MKEERSLSLDKIVSNLQKTYKDSLPNITEAGIVKRVVLSSPKLNFAFGGGLPVGRVIELFGPESGGKTVLACYFGSQVQQRIDGRAKTVVFFDIEHTFENKFATDVGLDIYNNFIFVRPLNGEEAFTIAEELVSTGEIGLIIWDSVAATTTLSQNENEYGKASYGSRALLFSNGLAKLNPYLSRFGTTLCLLNQVRDKIGGMQMPGMPKPESVPGGWAPKFMASWRARVSKVEDIKNKNEILGNVIRVKNVKNKIGIPKREIKLDLYYATGFNPDNEYIDFIMSLGLVKVSGAWISNEEWNLKCQGRDKLLAFLHENPELFEQAKAKVNESFTQVSAMDNPDDDVTEEDYVEGEEA
jgi:recombination protein RecA